MLDKDTLVNYSFSFMVGRTKTTDKNVYNSIDIEKWKNRKTAPATAHIPIPKKLDLIHLARTEGISESELINRFIDQGLRQAYHVKHSVLLQPIIEAAIHKEMTKYSDRQAKLLVRATFLLLQIKELLLNVLGRLPIKRHWTDEALNYYTDRAEDIARGKINRITPQLKTLLAEEVQQFKEKVDSGNH